MRLLVSLVHPVEVDAALSGGADILDVKDPATGTAAPPDLEVLRAICSAVDSRRPVSVALGESTAPRERLLERARAFGSCGVDFVKIALSGRRDDDLDCLDDIVQTLAATDPAIRVVGLAYADLERANGVTPALLPEVAATAGAYAVMLDTAYKKKGTTLLSHLQPDRLAGVIGSARAVGLEVGLAGSLDLSEITALLTLQPSVIGVRGAACRRGRTGRLDPDRVRRLAQLVGAGPSGVTTSHWSPAGSAVRK